jgi:hypothetical protein
VHGEQERGVLPRLYYFYGYLLLYAFCGRYLLAAKLLIAAIDAAAGAVEEVGIRARWPRTAICCAPTQASRGRA